MTARRRSDLYQTFRDEVAAPFLDSWRQHVYGVVMPVLAQAREFYAADRRRLNVVNYVDLLSVAARLLRENPDVRRALQAKYQWLFIDEFQDTDPIQAEVFLLLAGAEEPRSDPGLQPGSPTAHWSVRPPVAPRRPVRRRRPQAVHLSLSPCRHRHLQPREGPRPRLRRGGAAPHGQFGARWRRSVGWPTRCSRRGSRPRRRANRQSTSRSSPRGQRWRRRRTAGSSN